MTISDVIQGFNKAIDEARSTSNGYFLTSAVSIKRKIGTVKTITVDLYLVNAISKESRLIAKEQYTGSVTDTDLIVNDLSILMIKDTALIFKDHLPELIDGTYGTK